MFKTRCKFYCNDVKDNGTNVDWSMSPVYANNDPEHENSRFWKFTPCGKLEISVNRNEYQGEHPVVGKEYFLDITEA